ncbi:MAG: hypothetical protein JXR63_06160 [Spirochaetales bacterium]|nr:hypothetical protein [Spirochaetales bacterium]
MKKKNFILFLIFTILLAIASCSKDEQDSKPVDMETRLKRSEKKLLTQGKWYNDEYSFTFEKGKYKAFYTVGKDSGTLTGLYKISGNKVTIEYGELEGVFGAYFEGTREFELKLVKDKFNPKAYLYLTDKENNRILWNDLSFQEADKTITLSDNVECTTLGNKLSSTTTNVRIRKGPGTNYDYMEFFYLDKKTKKVKSHMAVLEGTNIRLLAKTKEKMQVEEWYNNWYYIEYKEPSGNLLVYKTAWMYGEFVDVEENKNRMITVEYPTNEEDVYDSWGVSIRGKVTGAPIKMKIQVKDSYGEVIFEDVISKYEQQKGTFEYYVSKENDTFFIGSNTYNFIAIYSDYKEVSKQHTFYAHESGGEMAKPVIYLYPKEETTVNVQVKPRNGFSITIPEYKEGGWNVIAKPDGTIINLEDNKVYPYLFWESENYPSRVEETGFIVKTTDLTDFFIEKLTILGLNEKEIADFIEFWIPILVKDEYYQIYFYDYETQNDNAPLKITPKPDTIIRVFFDSKPLSAPIEIKEQKLKKAKRKGFTVTEWGGMRYDR